MKPLATHGRRELLHSTLHGDRHAEMVALTYDVTDGLALCLQLLNADDMRRQNGDAPMLGIGDTTRLMRFALATVEMLRDETEYVIDSLNDYALKKEAA